MSSLTAYFVFKVYGKVMMKCHQKPDLCQKVQSVLNFRFSKPVEFPKAVTHNSLTVWSCFMDHREDERVSYCNAIQNFWSFGQSEAQKLSFVQPLFCPETEFNSEVDL
jgi:hypothetical protein